MKIVAITQARTESSRLPEKVLLKVGEETILSIHIRRALRAKTVDELIIATTTKDSDSRIKYLAKKLKVRCCQGKEVDVLDRYYQTAKEAEADVIVRITSDCPLIDPIIIDDAVNLYHQKKVDYLSNTMNPTFPHGVDVEVFNFRCLKQAWKESTLKPEREHVTPYIIKNSNYKKGTKFTSFSFELEENYSHYRITLDEPEDFEVIKNLIEKQGTDAHWRDYIYYLDRNPHIRKINARFKRNCE